MLDTKYAVKYKMPHSLLHIVDNSANADFVAQTVAEDPSLFSTIVVTATPMGVDNRIVNLTRADVASVSFGLGSITAEDIEKYGQTITYPMSLIENGKAPVKLLRVTPDGSTYAYAIILVQWCLKERYSGSEEKDMHVRFVKGELPDTLRPDRFKNTEKLNAAIIAGTPDQFTDEDGTVWEQRVFINALAAGRGKAYNDLAFAINIPQQGRRQANVRYEFVTINASTGLVVEDFYASLSNATTNRIYASTLDDLNTVVGKRVEGSSILIPYLNNKAVREVWKAYSENVTKLAKNGSLNDQEKEEIKFTDVNTFDMIYGNYIYDGGEKGLKLPAYYVDMLDTDIVRLPEEDQFKTILTKSAFDPYNPTLLYENQYPATYGVQESGDSIYVGDTYLSSDSGSYMEPGITIVAGINQYSGAITSMTYYNVKVKKLEDGSGTDLVSMPLTAYFPDVPIEDTDYADATDDAYVLLATQPIDWATAYTSYYVKISETTYTPVVGVAPAWEAGKYYTNDEGTTTEGDVNDTKPSNWDTNYADYYVSNGSGGYVHVSAVAPTWTTDTYYQKIEQGSVLVKFNNNNVLKRFIRNGVLPQDQTLAIAFTTTRNGVQTYDVASIYIHNNAVTKVALNDKPYDVISKIDFDSHAGGNVIGTSKTDSATYRVGMAYIIPAGKTVPGPVSYDAGTEAYVGTPRTVEESEVYVNGFMVRNAQTAINNATTPAVDPDVRTGRVRVIGNTNKFGVCPTAINLVDGVVKLGHAYDVLFYEDDSDYGDNPVIGYNRRAVVTTAPGIGYFFDEAVSVNGSVFTAGLVDTDITVGTVLVYPKEITEGQTRLRFIVTDVDGTGKIAAIKYVGGKLTYDGDAISGTAYTDASVFSDITDGELGVAVLDDSGNIVSVDATKEPGTITLKMADMRIYDMKNKIKDPEAIDPETGAMGYASIIASSINRYMITGTTGSLNRVQYENLAIPKNYYDKNYGVNPSTASGGFGLEGGYTGFFDENISDIEFKWKYSELLVKAYRGKIDPRILSPTRCPAKFLFDGGTNTIVGQTILSNVVYRPVDIMNSSTIFTEDEKDAVMYDEEIINGFIDTYDSSADIDVKQAMYDLMVYRCYYGMPEDKRPLGPGYGLSLHLDAGVTDASTALLINDSFKRRFTNPNASWDIGGYVSSENGIAYTYTKWTVDNMIKHCKATTINKPFVMSYATIPNTAYTSFFPDIDTTDWEMRELLYNSGGNAWIPDINGNLVRRSQRTLQTTEDTSDLVQESNMRTLSQLCYLLQNKIDSFLLEYDDDGSIKTLSDQVNNMFVNWPGYLVDALSITFERDINPLDGGDIVVCYCNVTFRGLILRVPIIVNVQRRSS